MTHGCDSRHDAGVRAVSAGNRSTTRWRCSDNTVKDAWVMAGGLDSFDWLKDRIKSPRCVVDLSQNRRAARRARDWQRWPRDRRHDHADRVVRHPADDRRSSAFCRRRPKLVASPQIRNQGTLGGNVSQDARCWYYRSGWPCYRAGGNICYADTPTAINREHAIFGADRCVAVNPSDTAPALIALDAKMVIVKGRKGERVVDAEDYFIGPALDITRMTVFCSRAICSPPSASRARGPAQFYFEKVRDRHVWDFPLVNVASAMKLSGENIHGIRMAANGLAAHPLRLEAVEAVSQASPECSHRRRGRFACRSRARNRSA